jgi:hypothetical protein
LYGRWLGDDGDVLCRCIRRHVLRPGTNVAAHIEALATTQSGAVAGQPRR